MQSTSPVGPSPATFYALPQLVFGGGWDTTLYFSNTTSAPTSLDVNFIGNDGAPLNVPILGIGTVSGQTVHLNPGATAVLEAPNTLSTSVEGWVNAALPPGVVGYAVFRQSADHRADQEAVVPLTSESSQSSDLVYDDTVFTTSVGLSNPSDQQVTVTITAYAPNGTQIGSCQVSLAPHAKEAAILKTLPGMQGVSGNRGWAKFSVPNGAISILGLRFGAQAFTSIPAPAE
jgi:hypothetical protein